VLPFSLLDGWLQSLGAIDNLNLFNRLLKNPDSQIRLGAIEIIRQLEQKDVIITVLATLKDEKDLRVKRASQWLKVQNTGQCLVL
jgi:HEAT repeat protein